MTQPDEFQAKGVIIPLLTPFDSAGKIDAKAAQNHIDWLIERGVGGIMPCGTTGEGPLLSLAEKEALIQLAVTTSQGRAPVMAHVGCITTQETIKLAHSAQEAGADALSIVTPYYYQMTDAALVSHYLAVARAVPEMPIFLYTIPHCTTNDLNLPVVQAICDQAANVIGMKDSSGNLEKICRYTAVREGHFQVICGSDGLLTDALECGAAASVSGNANIFPEIVVQLVQLASQGDFIAARQAQARLDLIRSALKDGSNLSLMKQALAWRGYGSTPVRPPLPEAEPELLSRTKDILIKNQLI